MRTILCPPSEKNGYLLSFQESDIDMQRQYVWNYILEHRDTCCLYVDWSDSISCHNAPPSMPYAIYTCAFEHAVLLNIIEELIDKVQLRTLIFDPFISHNQQSVAPLFAALKSLMRRYRLTIFLLLEYHRAPLIQAEIIIDPRR